MKRDTPRRDQLLVSFLPSVHEINESTLDDPYFAGLSEFHDSVKQLHDSVREKWQEASVDDKANSPRLEEYTGPFVERGAHGIARNAPPELVQFIMTLGSSGLAVGLYSLLRLWVDAKNGRKLRVKIGEFEVEASKMTPEEFQDFVQELIILRERDEYFQDRKAIRNAIQSRGLVIIEEEQDKELREIKRAFSESVEKARKKLREQIKGDGES